MRNELFDEIIEAVRTAEWLTEISFATHRMFIAALIAAIQTRPELVEKLIYIIENRFQGGHCDHEDEVASEYMEGFREHIKEKKDVR